jgi:hypothetical protein
MDDTSKESAKEPGENPIIIPGPHRRQQRKGVGGAGRPRRALDQSAVSAIISRSCRERKPRRPRPTHALNHTNDFDKACRYLAKRQPQGFFAWMLSGHEQALAFEKWEDTRRLPFPGEPDRTCDTVARFRNLTDPERPWIMVVEFQSRPQRWMPLRMLCYQGDVLWEFRPRRRKGRLPNVGGIIVNLTGNPRRRRLSMVLATHPDMSHRFSVVTRNLAADSAGQTVQAIAAGRLPRCVLPWVSLMQGGAESGIIQEWMRVAEGETDESLRADYAALVVVFAELASCRDVWRQALEEWNMQRSQQVLEWQRDAREKAEIETWRQVVLRTLRLRFQSLPEDVAGAVAGMSDLTELSRWHDLAVTASSLEAFRAAVQVPTTNGPTS